MLQPYRDRASDFVDHDWPEHGDWCFGGWRAAGAATFLTVVRVYHTLCHHVNTIECASGKQLMRRGYIRLSKAGPSRKAQEAALACAGIEDFSDIGPVHIDVIPKPAARPEDRHPQRAEAIRSLCDGDELVIASPARLGATREDILSSIKAIGDRGASIHDASTGTSYRWHPDAAGIAEFAALAEREGAAERTKKMRERKAELGAHAGPPARLEKGTAPYNRAKTLWEDLTKSAKEVAAETSVSTATLYRHFGPKGTPVFGGHNGREPKPKS